MPVKKVKTQTKTKLKVSKPAVKKAKVSTIKKSGLSPRVKGLNADVFDLKGKVVGKIELPKEVFGAKINKPLIAQAVRIYLINQRQGTSSTKTRGEVEGSTRKIYRQKGTGRARQEELELRFLLEEESLLGQNQEITRKHFLRK